MTTTLKTAKDNRGDKAEKVVLCCFLLSFLLESLEVMEKVTNFAKV